jgi:polysaccharide deacetylase 2 family uncharacterized protein YibQ
VLAQNMAAVPFAIGVNGHRGSLLTRHPGHMRWLMEEIDARGMLFVDSYTTPRSVALDMALEAGVPATRRDVFLDTDPAPESIDREFERLKALARRHGSAVAIGHPYPATLTFLERRLPMLAAQGFRLVGIRELLNSGGDMPMDMAAQRGRSPSSAPAAGQHVSAGGSHAEIRQETEPVRAGPL